MSYSKADLDEIRKKVDLLTFLESRGVSFRESGISWVGLCPVHSERSPSFHVKPAAQTFRCFGCGIGGDIFSLVMEMEQLTFPGAVQLLAEEVGLELKIDDDPRFKHRQRLLTIARLASEWYRYSYSQIPMDHPAKLNLDNRNLLEFSLSDDSVGFAPNDGLIAILYKKGFSKQEILDAGIANENEDGSLRERFRNRLIWTIYDIQGRPIGFSARKIFDNDNGPKYINSPQTELYNKSKALLGLSDAKRTISQQQEVFVVEGQTDVMALKAAGKINTIASCGTAFGNEHAGMLLHLSKLGREADKFRIVFCFDGDAAGVKAAKGVFSKNQQIHLNSYVVKFIDSNGEPTDPCDFRTEHGDEALAKFIDDNQVSLVEFIIAEEKSEWDLTTPEGKSGYITKAREILSHVTDPIQHSAYLRKVAGWTGLSYSQLQNMATRSRRPAAQQEDSVAAFHIEGDPKEITMLAALVQFPQEAFDAMRKFKMDLSFFPTQGELARKIIAEGEDNSFDYADPTINYLSHMELVLSSGRNEQVLEMLFKNYVKYLYVQESGKLDARLMEAASTPQATQVFQEVMEAQAELKRKFSA